MDKRGKFLVKTVIVTVFMIISWNLGNGSQQLTPQNYVNIEHKPEYNDLKKMMKNQSGFDNTPEKIILKRAKRQRISLLC